MIVVSPDVSASALVHSPFRASPTLRNFDPMSTFGSLTADGLRASLLFGGDRLALVLTGYNTDIDYSGTTYHVQTEDKGRNNPLVESLVYTSGEILYTRRTPYHDLVEQEVEKEAIASLMERQHRAIVEAVHAGRLEQLTGEIAVPDDDDTTVTHGHEKRREGSQDEPSLDQVILDYLEAQRDRAHLMLRAAADHEFVYDSDAQIAVTAVDSIGHNPQEGVKISVLFKSTSEPRRLVLAEGETGPDGGFFAEAKMPPFTGGTSAVVITAESDLGQSEMKHLVHR